MARRTHVSRGTWCPPPRKDPGRHSCCMHVDGPPPDRPDLALYSQDEQFALGAAPTWDNPDMLTNFWNPFKLMPEISVTARNLSPTASAVNGQLSIYISTFGLGMPRQLLSSKALNLPPGQQTTLLYPLSQAILSAAEQRIGTYAVISHPHDARRINNTGAQLIADAFTTQVGRSFGVTFPVMNPLASPQVITLGVLPNDLNAVISPSTRAFAPLEQIIATLSLQVPAAIHGTPGAPARRDATTVAWGADGKVIGGLTYVIWIDN
jgi:hypothetical protein